MKRFSVLALLAVPFLLSALPATGKTTPPKELCDRRGGRWDTAEQQCILPYKPSPNPPPVSTKGTGTRYEVNPKFKGDKWTVKR
ncbi:hypothetical protein ACN4EG_25220 [Alkalinema pantanalense CENA528]|uniref:hypothetical protein n=1 Tax=Alkalinema pantanalense TaxID=1620705 RepID=UPI003D6FEAD7